MSRILVIGGYGAFGERVVERLARDPQIEIVIAGRSAEKAQRHAQRLAGAAHARIAHAALDATAATPELLRELRPSVVINASGPFQGQAYGLARACVTSGVHYIDLADARTFVTGITTLDAAARAAGVTVISGASSVPGLSSGAVAHIAGGLDRLDEVHIGISPGNSFDPGIATVASIIGAAGKPLTMRTGGRETKSYGWQGLHRVEFPGIGKRWMSAVDVPDLVLLPQRYPQLATVRFSAGLEVGAFHLGLWAASWLARWGLARDLSPLAGPMLALKRRLSFLGSDSGGMFVRVVGRDAAEVQRTRTWYLVARCGHGPYVPAIASVILARRLAAGAALPRGAMPCLELFSVADFEAEVTDLDITCTLDGH